MRKIFLFLVLVSVSIPAFAENIYVSQGGTGDGTSCSSSRSAAWFNTSVNWGGGSGQINGGDTVNLCGTINAGLTMQGSGSSGNIITIDGTGATLSGVFSASNRSYFALNNLTSTYTSSYPLVLAGASYGSVTGFTMADLRYYGVDLNTSTGQTHDLVFSGWNITTSNDYIADAQRDVIRGCAYNLTLEKSYINKRWSSQNNATAHNDILQLWGTGANPACPQPSNIDVHHNMLITEANYDGNFQFIIIGNGTGANKIYGNVFVKKGTDTTGAFIIVGDSHNGSFDIYNNTFVTQSGNPPWYLWLMRSDNSNMTFNMKNNIVYNNQSSSYVIGDENGNPPPGSVTFNHAYNNYYGGGNYYLKTSCSSYTSTEESCNSNPLFYDYANGDFRIGANSPAYNTGTDLGTSYSQGLSTSSITFPNHALVRRPQATSWDKGAYEYTGEYTGGKAPMAPGRLAIN